MRAARRQRSHTVRTRCCAPFPLASKAGPPQQRQHQQHWDCVDMSNRAPALSQAQRVSLKAKKRPGDDAHRSGTAAMQG